MLHNINRYIKQIVRFKKMQIFLWYLQYWIKYTLCIAHLIRRNTRDAALNSKPSAFEGLKSCCVTFATAVPSRACLLAKVCVKSVCTHWWAAAVDVRFWRTTRQDEYLGCLHRSSNHIHLSSHQNGSKREQCRSLFYNAKNNKTASQMMHHTVHLHIIYLWTIQIYLKIFDI